MAVLLGTQWLKQVISSLEDCIFEKNDAKSYAHFENESAIWKWKHNLKIKAHFENESTLWKWKHILEMKAHNKNEST